MATPFGRWPNTWTTISDQDIVGLNIPTGIPLVYELDDDPASRSATITWVTPKRWPQAAAAVASQGKA